MIQQETELDQQSINTLRFLAVDTVQKAQSGHPGTPMGAAALAYVLWNRFLKHNPGNPHWADRDRFILSPGHASALLYSLLYLTGYDLSLEDLKQFRQWGSRPPRIRRDSWCLNTTGPTVLIFTRQNLPILDRSEYPSAEGLQRGGYILWENSENGASPQVIDGAPVVGYKDEQGVAATSTTESYVALKLFIENWRWAGVPFYLRTGKHLPKRSTEVTIQFKRVPHQLYKPTETRGLVPNRLTLRIQPDEGISLKFGAKVPGAARQLSSVDMNFSYASGFGVKSPEAYERLLADCMVGDSTLFIRRDEVEASWRMVDSITTAWRDMPASPVSNYPAGTWGPEEADDLIQNDGRQWANP